MYQRNISRKHHPAIPEVTPPFKNSTVPRSVLSRASPFWGQFFQSQARPKAAINLLDHRRHSWRSLCRQIIPRFKLATPFPTQIVTTNCSNHSYNQEHNPDHYEEISTYKFCSYENSYDLHHQLRFLGYLYTESLTLKGTSLNPRLKKNTNHSLLYQRL